MNRERWPEKTYCHEIWLSRHTGLKCLCLGKGFYDYGNKKTKLGKLVEKSKKGKTDEQKQ